MNNSRIAQFNVDEETGEDRTPIYQARETELVAIIESLKVISVSREWKLLKNEVFDGLVETLERQMKNESERDEVRNVELYRLQGQLAWARKYSDLDKLADYFRTELKGIQKQLKVN